MNAPVCPALLANPHDLHDLMLRVAEAVLDEATNAARGNIEAMRMGDRHREASERTAAASAVQRIDIEKLVAEFAIVPPHVDEVSAFESAARANSTNTLRNGKGEFVHPATQRAHAIWKLAVRWARNQAAEADRPP